MTADADAVLKATNRRYDEFYERYVRPLEAQHAGAFVAVSPEGETFVGATLREVAQRATERFGQGHFLFKVGSPVVGNIR